MMRHFYGLCFFVFLSTSSFAQNLIVKPVNAATNPLVDSLVQKIVGKGVRITNIRSNLKQSTRALATFRTNNQQLLNGMKSGLMMVTGVADTMAGSNNTGTISNTIPASDTVATAFISGKSLTNGVATITTNAPHNFFLGQTIKIIGVDNTFNGTHTLTAINSPTRFSFIKSGPNVAQSSVSPLGTAIGGCPEGRQMLNRVLAGNSTASRRATDCVTIQFDFIPATDTIRFNYIFASEEYNSFVCSNFNDIFGFFIKGPGINGDANLAPTFLNTKNIALIPGTNLPVSINTVNNGTPGSGPASDCDFTPQGIAAYIDNTTAGETIPAIYNNLRFNGLTRRLQAVVQVVPCQTYTLTLTVSDVTDNIYDSGVFIEAGSLESSGVTVVQSTVYNDRFPFAIVDCNPGRFVFERCSNDTAGRLVIPYLIDPLKSSAFNGKHVKQLDTNGNVVNLDYRFVLRKGKITDTLTVLGFDSAGISWADTLPKKLYIRLLDTKTPYFGGNPNLPNYSGDTAVLLIKRKFNYKASKDTSYCPGQEKLLETRQTSPSIYYYQWKELNRLGDTVATGSLDCDTCFNPISRSDSSTRYVVFVRDKRTSCLSSDTVNVKIDSLPEIGISTNKEAFGNVVCPSENPRLVLKSNPTKKNAGWTYKWSAIKSDSLWFVENVIPENSKKDSLRITNLDSNITFIVTAINQLLCSTSDTVQTFIPQKPKFTLALPSEICLGDSVKIVPTDLENFTKPFYAWEINCANWSYGNAAKEFVIFKPINETNCKISLTVQGCEGRSPLLITTNTADTYAKNCGFFIPSLVIINGLNETNRGFFIFENSAFDNTKEGRRFLNGGALRIYNRWGKEVYRSDSYQNELTLDKLQEKYQDGIYYYDYNNTARNFKRTGYFEIQR